MHRAGKACSFLMECVSLPAGGEEAEGRDAPHVHNVGLNLRKLTPATTTIIRDRPAYISVSSPWLENSPLGPKPQGSFQHGGILESVAENRVLCTLL